MADAQAVFNAMQETPGDNRTFTKSDFDLSPNDTGSRSLVASHKAIRPLVVREGVSWDAHIPAYQSETTDGTAGNDETVTLDHNLIDADGVADDVVVYQTGTDVTSDVTVDYAANEFTLANTNADAQLDIWYISDEQARLEIRKTAPANFYADLAERDAGMLNLRDQSRDPLTFGFADPFGGAVPTDWKVEVYIDAPYPVRWEGQANGATPRNALVSVPIHRKRAELEPLETVVKDRLDMV